MLVITQKTTRQMARYQMPEKGTRPAISWASRVVLVCKVPVEKPTAPPSRMMDTPTRESRPSAKDSITVMGTNGMNRFTP